MGRHHGEGRDEHPEGGFGPDGPFGRHGPFGEDGPFGKDGPFGEAGPFGRDGPFGTKGPFGPEGPFGGRGGQRAAGRGFGINFGPGGFHFEFGRGGRGFRGGGGGRGRRRMFESGELRLVLLKLIADEPRHGYDLIRAIEEMTGGDYAPSPGVVYPTLTLLEDMGLVSVEESGGPKKRYAVTGEGRAHLEEKADEVAELLERLAEHGEKAERHDRQPIKRAVANVMTALWHQMSEGELDEEKLHRIAEILDKAARKIERL